MKREEFVAIVNEVADEERSAFLKQVQALGEEGASDPKLLANLFIRSVDSSSRCAAKIIERAGLLVFDE